MSLHLISYCCSGLCQHIWHCVQNVIEVISQPDSEPAAAIQSQEQRRKAELDAKEARLLAMER